MAPPLNVVQNVFTAMIPFSWSTVLSVFSRPGAIVPVLGAELLIVKHGADAVPFLDLLGRQLAVRMNIAGLPNHGGVGSVLAQLRRQRVPIIQLTSAIAAAYEELIRELGTDVVPGPLRKLAGIRAFTMFVTTTPDDLLVRALREAGRSPLVVTYSARDRPVVPPSWGSDEQPLVVQLFGRISPEGGFALAEDDVVELICNMQTDRRPEALLGELKRRHILFLGNNFPDWLMRLFMRTLRGAPFSTDSELLRAFADGHAGREVSLVSFLTAYSRDTFVYEGSGALQFVDELRQRLDAQPPPVPDEGAPETQAKQIAPGVIFLSYSNKSDLAFASRVQEQLTARNLDVWLDAERLRSGDRWNVEIEEGIRTCHLFVPIISRSALGRNEGYFIREWKWALRRLEGTKNRSFVVPMLVDDSVSHDELLRDELARQFCGQQMLRAPNGQLSESQVDELVALLRAVRGDT